MARCQETWCWLSGAVHLQFDACIQDLVRCVALTKLVHEEEHLKQVKAHVTLAKAYLKFKGKSEFYTSFILSHILKWCQISCLTLKVYAVKLGYFTWLYPSGWGLQSQEHLAMAREMLPFCSSISPCKEEKLKVLLSLHLTWGGTSLLLDKYPYQPFLSRGYTKINLNVNLFCKSSWLFSTLGEAESSFLEAEQILRELHQLVGISQEEKLETELEICNGLSRLSIKPCFFF